MSGTHATSALAEEPSATAGIEETINGVFEPVSDVANDIVFATIPMFGTEVPWIVLWLVVAAVTFSVYFKFLQVRRMRLAFDVVRGRYTSDRDPGEVSHFRALTAALSGTVGLGNIAGVAVAVTIGGAGATFWMILCGFLGMATKFVECTLGVKYREVHADGTVSGGPMHYLRRGLVDRFGRKGAIPGRVLAFGAALLILVFGIAGGNMFQSNQTFAQLRSVTGGDDGLLGGSGAALLVGGIMAGLVALVIIGGIKSISRVTSRLVPLMAFVYVAACLTVIAVNLPQVPAAFGEILSGAFAPEGVAGGAIGALIVGFQRALFSNEAGIGSAPIAHAAVKTRHPVTEGLVAMLEPFVDTVVVCTMTALTIVIAQTPSWQQARDAVAAGGDSPEGVTLTSDAFATVLPWFPVVLSVAVALFAFSTVLSWAYYGQKAWNYLFGLGPVRGAAYKVVVCGFIVLGAVLTLDAVVSFMDAMMFVLAFLNIIGLYLLAPVVKRELADFMAKLSSGELTRTDREKVDVTD
ncbi:D-alanine glycine permease [Saccharomonospora piscinae]|uniref:D-alanine glycine permease n=1 Tax=Saccharomonospora piscinae TaxID=687388 RepID=A0A1V8ZXB9_SACPI|nr:alanine/glycine:cation symporter family protein [Saccharomonospora piscinae]OQO89441.1 D-alanine glycine permease [Saccharomonospora piscinae]